MEQISTFLWFLGKIKSPNEEKATTSLAIIDFQQEGNTLLYPKANSLARIRLQEYHQLNASKDLERSTLNRSNKNIIQHN